MQRVFSSSRSEDRIAEYRERHAAVWTEMRAALSATGRHSYRLFLRDVGLLVGYPETEDFEAAMDVIEVNPRRQAQMAPFFEALD